MLSREEGQRLPTPAEREACKSGEENLCHGIVISSNRTGSLELKSDRERDKIRQNIDWVSGHCQTVQCTAREQRKDLPCFKLREVIFRFNK